MYRNTPHSVTGVCPAELLFKRKLRTKLPSLQEYCHEEIVRDRDKMLKQKGKEYADQRRHASYSEIVPGDTVLLKQEGGNKLSTPFRKDPCTVVDKIGNSVVVENKDGVMYRRNSSFVKKFHERNKEPDIDNNEQIENVDDSTSEVEAGNGTQSNDVISDTVNVRSPRPTRTVRMPVKFQDYVLSC